MSLADYANRKYDLCIIQPSLTPGQISPQTLIDTDGGEICAGLHALVQRFIIELFTAAGSMRFSPGRGCGFLLALRAGALRTELQVITYFNLAAVQVYENLKKQEGGSVPADEAYAGVSLNSVIIYDTTLQLDVTVFSEAGSAAKFIVPISYLPAPLAV